MVPVSSPAVIPPNFTRGELACRCGCDRMDFSTDALAELGSLREYLAFPMPISSGNRCPKHDADAHRLRHPDFTDPERHGAHTIVAGDNLSVDVVVNGNRARRLVWLAVQLNWTGIGVHQKGPHTKRFVHLDRLPNGVLGPRPWVWSY